MTKIILSLLLGVFYVFFLSFAQDKGSLKITYSQFIKYKNTDSIKINNSIRKQYIDDLLKKKYFELVIMDKKSEYSEILKINNQQSISMFQISSPHEKIYKDFENNMIIYKMNFPSKTYVKDSLKNLEWNIQEKSDTIVVGYKSHKATISTKDIKITAFFTKDIPISDGPEEYYGLPGLIVYLEIALSNNNEIHIKQLESINIDKRIDLKFPQTKRMISMEEYNQIIDEFIEKRKTIHSNTIE
ncbi:MAG: GLPGLI family protein [Moheibacter sp.]